MHTYIRTYIHTDILTYTFWYMQPSSTSWSDCASRRFASVTRPRVRQIMSKEIYNYPLCQKRPIMSKETPHVKRDPWCQKRPIMSKETHYVKRDPFCQKRPIMSKESVTRSQVRQIMSKETYNYPLGQKRPVMSKESETTPRVPVCMPKETYV